jgi:hypothetical protein
MGNLASNFSPRRITQNEWLSSYTIIKEQLYDGTTVREATNPRTVLRETPINFAQYCPLVRDIVLNELDLRPIL